VQENWIVETKKFFVSVIIPVFNGEVFLAEAVESIWLQNYQPLEIIIIDDGSTDGTAEIARGFSGNVIYEYQTNSGPSVARNKGIAMARGNIIGFIDVDDLWSDKKLEVQLDYLRKDLSADIVMGYTQRMQRTENEKGKFAFKNWEQPLLTMHIGSALFRKSVFDKVGLFDESLGFCEDWDWFMRAKELHVSIAVLKEVTYLYRRHQENMTNDTEINFKYALKMIKLSLDRRRKHHGGRVGQLPKLSDFTVESLLPGSDKKEDGEK